MEDCLQGEQERADLNCNSAVTTVKALINNTKVSILVAAEMLSRFSEVVKLRVRVRCNRKHVISNMDLASCFCSAGYVQSAIHMLQLFLQVGATLYCLLWLVFSHKVCNRCLVM
jgi:hypothetical protein